MIDSPNPSSATRTKAWVPGPSGAVLNSNSLSQEMAGSLETWQSEVTALLQLWVALRMPLSSGPTNDRLQWRDSVAAGEEEEDNRESHGVQH